MKRLAARLPPGSTGFLATLILVGCFAVLASSLWTSRPVEKTAVAIEETQGVVAVVPADASIPAASAR
ncbi:MAG: hypothetical protein WC829_22725 [Hyphomicrobium sp.]